MKIKLTYIIKQHYVQSSTALFSCKKINVTSALSRVESALHREDVIAVVGFLASKKGRSVDEYEISVATTTRQLLSSQQLDYCCCRRNSHADITDERATIRLVDHRSVEELLYRLRYGLLATIFIPCAHSVSMGANGDFEK